MGQETAIVELSDVPSPQYDFVFGLEKSLRLLETVKSFPLLLEGSGNEHQLLDHLSVQEILVTVGEGVEKKKFDSVVCIP